MHLSVNLASSYGQWEIVLMVYSCHHTFLTDRLVLHDTYWFLFVSSYDNKEIALNCGNMLRDCIRFPTLAK